MTSNTSEERRVTARFPRLSSRGLIMGLGKAQLVLVGIAFVGVIVAFVTQLWLPCAVVVLLSLALVPTWFTGRPLVNRPGFVRGSQVPRRRVPVRGGCDGRCPRARRAGSCRSRREVAGD